MTSGQFEGATPIPSRFLRRLGPVATIALAQLFGTSLWFSANSATDTLMISWQISAADIGWLTNAVQGGFILGTMIMALGGLAERYRASLIFVVSAACGALFNACFAWFSEGLASGIVFRFLVGLSLAGIYPVGMKLIVSWAPERTGQALAQLVAMLTLGTALPHALREAGADLPWQYVILASSLLALFGAVLIHLLGDGPHLPGAGQKKQSSGTASARPLTVFDAFKVQSISCWQPWAISGICGSFTRSGRSYHCLWPIRHSSVNTRPSDYPVWRSVSLASALWGVLLGDSCHVVLGVQKLRSVHWPPLVFAQWCLLSSGVTCLPCGWEYSYSPGARP